MANTAITGLTANTAPLAGDLAVMVDDPGGTPLSQKITFANLFTTETPINIGANTLTATGTHTGPSGTWDSGGFDLAASDSYAIAGTDVLTATVLGTAVVTSSLTTVGALDSGSITSGFGTIDTGASSITTTGALAAGVTTITGALLSNADDGGAIGASGTGWSDLFLASGAVINFNAGDVTLTHGSNLLTVAGGAFNMGANTLYVNDTANVNMTVGVTINQGASDDEGVALKSSDVGHAATNLTEADTFGVLKKVEPTAGGLQLAGYKDGDGVAGRAIELLGVLDEAAGDTTKTTAAIGNISLFAALESGNALGVMGADENLAVISNNGTARFIFDAEGSAHADVEWVAFDAYDDLAVISGLEAAMLDQNVDRELYEETGIVGRDSWHVENGKLRAMVNTNKLAMLHHGALMQIGQRLEALEQRM